MNTETHVTGDTRPRRVSRGESEARARDALEIVVRELTRHAADELERQLRACLNGSPDA